MAAPTRLTDEDLARPAKELPLKVIRGLGHQLHRHLNTSGNWEILAGELGYEYEDIKLFSATANIRQEVTPGELLLRDWVDKCSSGHTLYVLRNALCRAERYDCADYMEKEVFNNVIHMDLTVCIKDEACLVGTQHVSVRTRTDASLLDSLQNLLQQPLEHNYKLLDPGATWTRTLARQYKGRALMLHRTVAAGGVGVDQDPTVDSSNMEDEPSDTHAVWNPTPAAAMPRRRANIRQPSLRQSIGPVPNEHNNPQFTPSINGTSRKQVSSIPEQRESYSSGMADTSSRTEFTGLKPGQTVHRNSHCDSCRCEDFPQNNLNLQASGSVCSIKVARTDNGPSCMNIHSEVKVDNVKMIQGSETGWNKRRDTKQKQIVPVRAEATAFHRDIVSEGRMRYVTDDATMVDSDYKQSFEDIPEDAEYRDDFETHGGQTLEMERLKLGFDETLLDSRTSLGHFRQSSIFDSQRQPEASYTTSSSDSDMELIDQKLIHFDSTKGRDNVHCMSEVNSITDSRDRQSIQHAQMLLNKEDVDDPNVDNDPFYETEKAICPVIPQTDKTIGMKTAGRPVLNMRMENVQMKGDVRSEKMAVQIDSERGKSKSLILEPDVEHPDRNTGRYPYIDFNNFTQTSPDQEFSEIQSFSRDSRFENDQVSVAADDESEPFVSEGGQMSSNHSHASGFMYEGLQRHISCPGDFRPYETSENAFNAFSTIADVFSPIKDKPAEVSFVLEQGVSSVDNAEDSEVLPWDDVNRRHSFAGRKQAVSVNSEKTSRHTFTQGQKLPVLSVHFSDQERTLACAENMDSGNIPPPRPHKFVKVRPHPYKIVVRGRPDKRLLDGDVVGDNLFTFYNNTLRGELGWSPLETEYTVETTMRDVLQQDGFYIMWYNRTKRNLMLTISDRSEAVHIRVHSKVQDNHLNFYIIPGHLYRDVRQLLQECVEQGLSLNSSRTGTGHPTDRKIWMKCPVMVQYERKPAVSV